MYISAASRLPPPVLHVDSIKTDPSRAGVTAANERQINLDHTLSRGGPNACMHVHLYSPRRTPNFGAHTYGSVGARGRAS
jgi:hypothetical protein